jgi:hypothetical protein
MKNKKSGKGGMVVLVAVMVAGAIVFPRSRRPYKSNGGCNGTAKGKKSAIR